VALVAAARPERARSAVPRWFAAGSAALLAVPALVGVLAYAPLGSARAALDGLRLEQAADEARSARRFAPWASAPWELLGDVEAQRGDRAAARDAYREALERDGSNWELWLALAAVSTGNEQRLAIAHAVKLNPRSAAVRELRDAVHATAGS
jgi:cytochrome c-type biogenesis protein CcmH/NrfG